MKAQASYAIMGLLAVAVTTSMIPAFSQSPTGGLIGTYGDIPITVETDQSVYSHDSDILVTGAVANIKPGFDVTITVTSPSNTVISIDQLDVDNNLEFGTVLSTSGSLWKYDGTYVIRVQYGEHGTSNKALVELTGGVAPVRVTPPTTCDSADLAVGSHCVPYTITGGTVTGAEAAGDEFTTLSIDINSIEDGVLSIEPFRSGCSEDGDPLIYVDGEQSDDYIAEANTIEIPFSAGAEKIEITGVCVVPEFGTIAVLVLAVAIVSIIAVTARSRLAVPGI